MIKTVLSAQSSTELTIKYASGSFYTYRQSDSASVRFTKPDMTQPQVPHNGYRKPTSWHCQNNGSLVAIGNLAYQEGVWPGHMNTVSTQGSLVFRAPTSGRPSLPNINNLRMKILNNVRSEVFDVAMVLAELQGTTDFLTTQLLRLARGLDSVKSRKPESFYYLLNGRRRDGRRPTDKFLRETAGTYLEWKYGAMPLVFDIQGACEALDLNESGGLFDNPALLVARAEDVQRTVVRTPFWANCAFANITQAGEANVEWLQMRKARLDYQVDGEGLRGLNRYGLGLGTLPTILFERTPFSFVLNMAVPIAELIKAWTALAGVTVVGYCETEYEKAFVPDHAGIDRSISSFPRRFTFQKNEAWWRFQRIALASPPMPLPFIRNPIKAGNIATVLSLFTQLRSPQGYPTMR